MAELLAEVPTRALAIYAHPDDPDVSCGGTLATWAQAGCDVRVLLCTDGGKGTLDPDVDPRALAVQRAAEAAEATAQITAKRGRARTHGEHSLGHPDPGATSFALLMAAVAPRPQGDDADPTPPTSLTGVLS